MPRLLSVLLLGVVVSAASAVAPPARLSDAQRTQLKEARALNREMVQLHKAGKLAEAVAAATRMLAAVRSVYGDDHAAVATSLGWLAYLRGQRGDHAAAAAGRGEQGRVLARLWGPDDWRVVDARWRQRDAERMMRLGPSQRADLGRAFQLNQQGGKLYQAGNHKGALRAFQQALKLRKEALGERHPDYANTLNNLALLHKAMGDHRAALLLLQQALKLYKEALGEKHPLYATRLNNLASLHLAMGDHNAALPLFQQALKLTKEVFGERHPNYATSLNNLAMLHEAMGDHQAALPLLQQALKLHKEVLGERHPSYANTLNNLASLHQAMGNHRAALPLLRQALQLRQEILGQKHPDYATSLNNLASLHHDMGDHKAALPLFQQALKLYKEALGERHPNYAGSLNNLAKLHQTMGDRKAALPLLQQALNLRKEVLGERHPAYATSLNSLAALYKATGDHKAALPLLQQALNLHKEVLGKRHPAYASSLNSLAVLHHEMGDHKAALPLFQQALKLRKEVLGESHPAYANSLNNLAMLHHAMGDHRAALPLLRQALALRKEALGERHPAYASSLNNLALLHQAMGEYPQAVLRSETALAITLGNLRDAASVQSERQQLAAAQALRGRLDLRLSLAEPPASGAAASYRHVLSAKGAVLLAQQQRRLFAALRASGSPEVARLAAQLHDATRALAALALAPTDGRDAAARQRRLEELTREKEELEGQLSTRAADFRATRAQARLEPAALAQALPEGVALVDLLFFTRRDHAQKDPSKRWRRWLTAFVVRKGRPVARIDLGEAGPVEAAVASWRQALARKHNDEGGAGAALRKLVWEPLRQHIQGAATVLISPDGALGKVPFAALPGGKPGTYLIEEVALAVVPVPQTLPALLQPVPKDARLKPSLLLVGDVDFDSAEVIAAAADERSPPRGALKGWQKLPGTQVEAAAVKDLFGTLFKKGSVTDLRGAEARKAAVREGLCKHRFVHLATHGFFAPPELVSALDSNTNRDREGMFGRGGVSGWHPLLLSGIVLAGANRQAKPGEEDGVLSALEVSELDLSRLELAVLSACQTGLGQEAGGEGLLGLQRAFAGAGARSTVASLWEVSDGATQELMAGFYRAWWDPKKIISRAEALRQAQLAMLGSSKWRGTEKAAPRVVKGKPVEQRERAPPYYWAAFVLAGDWR